jgi:hypothetical protein
MPLWTSISDALQQALGRREHLEERASPLPRPETVDPRDSALGKMLWSAPLAALTLFAVYALSQWGKFDAGFKLVGPFIAVLLVPFLVHGTEFITNVRFSDLSERWDQLTGWQRGILGISLVLLAALAIFSLAFAFAIHLGSAPPPA